MSDDTLDFALNIAFPSAGAANDTASTVEALARAMMTASKESDKLAAAQVKAASAMALVNAKGANAIEAINAKGSASFQLTQQKQVGQLLINSRKSQDAADLARVKSKLKQEETLLKGSAKSISKSFDPADLSVSNLKSEMVEAAGSAGILVAAYAALAAATVGVVAWGAKFALTQAEQKQNVQLSLEAMLGSADAGKAMEEQFQNLSKSLPISRDRVDELGKSLILAGQRGDTLTDTLKALATVESTAGAEGADKLRNLIEKWNAAGKVSPIPTKALAGTGVTLEALNTELSKRLKTTPAAVEALMKAGKIKVEDGVNAMNAVISSKLGDVAGKKLLGLTQQFDKAKENIGNLFEDSLGPDGLEAFEKGIHDVLSLFDDTTETGKTIKFLLGELFTPLFHAITGSMPLVKAFFQGIVIGALKIYIAMKPVIKAFDEFAGLSPDTGLVDLFVTLGKGIAYTTGVVVALLAATAAVGALFVAPFVAGGAAVVWFLGKVVDAYDWITSLDFGSIGSKIIDGLVNGITSGVGLVVDAVKGLGTSAMNTLKATLGIASPSKEFAKLGGHTATGFAMGVDGGADAANDSLSAMAAPPDVAPSGRGGGGPVQVIVNVDAKGASAHDAETIANTAVEKVISTFESLGLSVAAPVRSAA